MASEQTKQMMMRAKKLIQANEYGKARKILEQVNHPTATKWLAQLDEIELGDPFAGVRTSSPATGEVPDYTNKFVISLVLLLIFVIPGIVATSVYAGQAKKSIAVYGEDIPYAKALVRLNKISFWILLLVIIAPLILTLLFLAIMS